TCKKVAIPVKYACDVSIGQCKKDSNGTYPSLIACSMDCAQKTIYRCWHDTGRCNVYAGPMDENNPDLYPSLIACSMDCTQTTTMFYCDPTGQCKSTNFRISPDVNLYPSLIACSMACTPRYTTCQKGVSTCQRCSNNKPGYMATWNNCGPCDYDGGIFDPTTDENGNENDILYYVADKCGPSNAIKCGSPEVGGICVNSGAYCGKVLNATCGDANLACCHKDYTYAYYACSRCSNNYGCAMATWNNKNQNCDNYNPDGVPTYKKDKKCGTVTNGDNITYCNAGGTTPPSTTCASKGGTCVLKANCPSSSVTSPLGEYGCGSGNTCCKSISAPTSTPTETCASKGGKCKDYRLCTSQTLLGTFNCTGTNYCCK
ncbi:MAG: hypothetical protein NTW73_01620, partial [Candidatus Parcubacteria bacterium]|nr:hypothetical protein [Candidatus Parcubacteria bacterium]